ncbi:MAG: UxaA family hydrolase [Pseudomonadota bacterium]
MSAPGDNGKLPPLLLLHPDDNILVARRDIAQGERVEIDGASLVMPAAVELGHKLARRALEPDTRVLKYGAPIGSMKIAVARGEHVHLHNLRSDYIPSTSRDGTPSKTDADAH